MISHLDRNSKVRGFTAPELLVTLFIAAIFFMAGYQLYVQVTQDGKETSKIGAVSNVVYEKLRLASKEDESSSCPSTPTPNPSTDNNVPVPNEKPIAVTITYSCIQYGTDNYVLKVEATGEYKEGTVSRKLTHATYVK